MSISYPKSQALFERNRRFIPGGVVSLNRKVDPEIAFVNGKGSRLWDADGTEYLDYHAAFGPYLLGHNHPAVEGAVASALKANWTLTGTGTTPWEGRAAELLVECVPTLDRVQFTNTGSEATFLAIRLARAFTGKDHVVVMQGGYNGWHDEVACNVMTPLALVGPERHDGEYPFVPMSAGLPANTAERVHVIQFNSLEAVQWAFTNYPVAALITEPILQNIGVVKPKPGYLAGLRRLCDEYNVVLIIDEVKTGFRHALAGYHSLEGIQPDIAVFGKAIANGYPVGALGGKAKIMDLFDDPDSARRVLIAGTYNGHPVPMAACIATMEYLQTNQSTIYPQLESLGQRIEDGINAIGVKLGRPLRVGRQGSALAPYYMDHLPESWHDIAANHDMALDVKVRQRMIERQIYTFPLATKQWSISIEHTIDDIDRTIAAFEFALSESL